MLESSRSFICVAWCESDVIVDAVIFGLVASSDDTMRSVSA